MRVFVNQFLLDATKWTKVMAQFKLYYLNIPYLSKDDIIHFCLIIIIIIIFGHQQPVYCDLKLTNNSSIPQLSGFTGNRWARCDLETLCRSAVRIQCKVKHMPVWRRLRHGLRSKPLKRLLVWNPPLFTVYIFCNQVCRYKTSNVQIFVTVRASLYTQH